MASTQTSKKETLKPSGTIKSYFKSSKNVRSRIPVSGPSKNGQSTGTKKTNVRPVPDFSKLHQQWQKKLECGKAITKKPCTVSQEFDLTRPGTSFTHTVQRELSFSCESPAPSVADNPLTSFCDIRLEDEQDFESESRDRPEPSKGVKRRVLGELTSRELNSPKSPRTSSSQKSKFTAGLVSQLSDEQNEPGVDFVKDDKALESILSEQGVQPSVVSLGDAIHNHARLTEQPSQAPRLSLFGQKAPRFSMRELHTASPGLFGVEAVRVRNSIYMTYQHRPRLQEMTPRKETPKPKLQAVRVPISHQSLTHFQSPAARVTTPASSHKKSNTHAVRHSISHQSPTQFASPALRVTTPASCLKKEPTDFSSKVKTQSARKCRWADLLASPVHPSEAVRCNLEKVEEASIDGNTSQTEIGSDEINQAGDNPKVVVKDFPVDQVPSKFQTQGSNDNSSVSEAGSVLKKIDINIDDNAGQSGDMVAETVFPEVTKFISKTLKHRRQSVDELNQNINESEKFLGKLECKAKRLSYLQDDEGIVEELSRIKKLKEELAAVEKSLKKRLRNQENVCDISGVENVPPQNVVGPHLLDTRSNCVDSVVTCKPKSDISQSIHAGTCPSGVDHALLPLDLCVKSVITGRTSDSCPPCDTTFETLKKEDIHLTPFITEKVADLKLTETTTLSGDSKETVEKQLTCSDSEEAKKQDNHWHGSTSKTQVSLTKSWSGDAVAPHFCGIDLKIVSPVAEKKITPTTPSTSGDDLDGDFVAPPIWTPLALRSAGALSLPRPCPEPAEDSHAVSMVVDVERCQSNDDSHRLLCFGSQSQSASCINQSAVDSEDGSRASRHHLGFSDCKSMTHAASCCYLSASPHNSSAIPVLPKHQRAAAHVLHKCGQAELVGHNLQDSAEDGHADAKTSPEDLCLFEQLVFDPSDSRPSDSGACQQLFDTQGSVRSPSQHSRGSSLSEQSSHLHHLAKQFQGRLQTFQGHGCFQPRTAEKTLPGDSSEAEASDQHSTPSLRGRRTSPVTRDNGSSSSRRQVTSPHSSEVGPLSLTGNLQRSLRPAAVVSQTTPAQRHLAGRLHTSQHAYLEMLLDEECALFTCCRRPEPTDDSRCPNPVATLLSEGDTMHFLPISDDYHKESAQLAGSAFSTYTPVHTRSMERPN